MSALIQDLNDYLTEYERIYPFSGTILVAQHGEIVFSKAYGYASLEHLVPNTADTKFRIWSLTKSFTAMAIMMLYEQKLLKFDDHIYLYLPECAHLKGITISHLLTHTSGLANNSSLPEFNKTLNKLKLSQKDVLDLFINEPLAFQPGTSFAYNNSGYFLLGMIIEKITGVTFDQYVTDHILKPLGMENTGVDNNKRLLSNMSSAYSVSSQQFIQSEYMDMSAIFSAGAMYSTVNDLFKWDQAFYSKQLVSLQTLELAFATNEFNYGFGWFLDNRNDRKRVYHGGAYRGHRSEMHRYPDEATTVIMLTNYDFVPVKKVTESISGILFGEKPPIPALPPAYSLEKHIYDKYMGTYEGFGCTAVVDRNENQLFFIWNEEEIITFYPLSETKFHHTWYDWDCEFTVNSEDEIMFLGMKKTK